MRLKILSTVNPEMVFATDPKNMTDEVGVPYAIAPEILIKLEKGQIINADVIYPEGSSGPKRRIEKVTG